MKDTLWVMCICWNWPIFSRDTIELLAEGRVDDHEALHQWIVRCILTWSSPTFVSLASLNSTEATVPRAIVSVVVGTSVKTQNIPKDSICNK